MNFNIYFIYLMLKFVIGVQFGQTGAGFFQVPMYLSSANDSPPHGKICLIKLHLRSYAKNTDYNYVLSHFVK